jgi:hypothetical protein
VRKRRPRAWALAIGLLVTACTEQSLPPPTASPSVSPPSPSSVPPSAGGPEALCTHPEPSAEPPAESTGELPASIAAVAEQVERVRGLDFKRPVSPERVTPRRMARLVSRSLSGQFPSDMQDRRERAWAAIGAIPAGTDLRESILDFGTSQIIGFYDTVTGRLVYVSDESPSPLELLTLAHELTHALDDQHFDLGLVDELVRTCQDERFEALVSLAEGSAVEMSLRWAQANLSAGELVQLALEAGGAAQPPASTPAFVRDMFLFPYLNGQAFVRSLLTEEGLSALDAAFANPPRSTEQILHPERYPTDEPQVVEVPDLREELGSGWQDLDAQDVGEGWLVRLLRLELPASDAGDAAAGWDGGQYRAWSNGAATAVVLDTVWDSDGEAAEFAQSFELWAEDRPVAIETTGARVRLLFGSDRAALDDLEQALAQG